MSASPILLELSTQISPPKKIKIDGVDYELLGTDHLNPNDEAESQALFARFGVLSVELEHCSNTTRGKDLAERMRKTRVQILCKLTTAPKPLIEKLPLSAQAKLLEAVNIEQEGQADEDGSGEEEGGDSEA